MIPHGASLFGSKVRAVCNGYIRFACGCLWFEGAALQFTGAPTINHVCRKHIVSVLVAVNGASEEVKP